MQLDVPILFLVFNRPDTTKTVFERIKEAQPTKLFIAADGPRAHKEGEKEKCEEVRSLIMNHIDWPCDVKTLFRKENLGCGPAVSQGITWFFDNVEEGIVLEDDTLPDISFFNYCRILLNKYRNDPTVMLISGDNFQDGKKRGDGSYYFSAYNHIWGWASWRRAWANYDYRLSEFTEESLRSILKKYFSHEFVHNYWLNIFRDTKEKRIEPWDFQWTFSIWKAGGKSVLPNTNLVTNIGFGEDATHTKDINSDLADIKTGKLQEIIHPSKIEIDKKADEYTSIKMFKPQRPFIKRLKRKIRKLFYG